MRWQALGRALRGDAPVSRPAAHRPRARELLGPQSTGVALLDVSGARDETVRWLMDRCVANCSTGPKPARCTSVAGPGTGSASAAPLSRPARQHPPQQCLARLQAAQGHRGDERTAGRVLAALALVELSEYHFSRMFKRATGLSPSQYFIGLRMRSCCLKHRAASSTSGWRWATRAPAISPRCFVVRWASPQHLSPGLKEIPQAQKHETPAVMTGVSTQPGVRRTRPTDRRSALGDQSFGSLKVQTMPPWLNP